MTPQPEKLQTRDLQSCCRLGTASGPVAADQEETALALAHSKVSRNISHLRDAECKILSHACETIGQLLKAASTEK